MPVAVGTGGKTVAFRGELSAEQTGLTTGLWSKVNLSEASIDTDSALVDGKFKPSVAGYYQVNGGVYQACAPTSTITISTIYKNGIEVSRGTQVQTAVYSYSSRVMDIIYLDGKDDYIELYGRVDSTGTCAISSNGSYTFLSAVLVSGGSGGSIWTDADGVATYDGNVKIKESIFSTEDNINLSPNNVANLRVSSDGTVNFANLPTSASVGNAHISAGGFLYRSTATMYSTQEVDKMLAIKDTLIEKLSARLDAIEKKVK